MYAARIGSPFKKKTPCADVIGPSWTFHPQIKSRLDPTSSKKRDDPCWHSQIRDLVFSPDTVYLSFKSPLRLSLVQLSVSRKSKTAEGDIGRWRLHIPPRLLSLSHHLRSSNTRHDLSPPNETPCVAPAYDVRQLCYTYNVFCEIFIRRALTHASRCDDVFSLLN
jgi:hypothetical protein